MPLPQHKKQCTVALSRQQGKNLRQGENLQDLLEV